MKNFWRRCTNYSFMGRVSRREYWMFVLWQMIFAFLFCLVDTIIAYLIVGSGHYLYVCTGLFTLLVCVPTIFMQIMRLHDSGLAGGWYFLNYIPIIGTIIVIVLLCRRGQPGKNKYGDIPGDTAQRIAQNDPVPAETAAEKIYAGYPSVEGMTWAEESTAAKPAASTDAPQRKGAAAVILLVFLLIVSVGGNIHFYLEQQSILETIDYLIGNGSQYMADSEENSIKVWWYEKYTCLIFDDDPQYYHKYRGCELSEPDELYCWNYDVQDAQDWGYQPCPVCYSNNV